jgi:antirestriction protein ArdC
MRSAKTVPHSSSEERLSPAERVTRQIKAALARGVRPWVKPWSTTGAAPLVLPLRANGIPYRGVNTLALWAAAEECGFSSPHWFTYKQCEALGANVRKGERGSFVVFYKQVGRSETDADSHDKKPDLKRILRGYVVFNGDQVSGLPESFFPVVPAVAQPRHPDEVRLTGLFAKIPATIRYGGDRAFYAPGLDIIQMPPKSAFPDATRFLSTKAHELAHWTRAPSRLDRDFGQKRFGDSGYALEELVAELASAFIGAQIGLPADHIEDHAAYISGWLTALEDNASAFLSAAAMAQTAADYLLDLMGVTAAAPEAVDETPVEAAVVGA